MNEREYILLFNSLHPNFFESEYIRSLPEEYIFEEMLLPLNEFDVNIYNKKFGGNVSFGFYDGELDRLKREVEKVDEDWIQFFDGKDRIFCGYADGKIAGFCQISDLGIHKINGQELKIGGPGCVGTIPEYRDKGIGLTMVGKETQILKDEGYDYSYIHYTYVAEWYAKLGYRTSVKWNRNGIITDTQQIMEES